MSLRERTSVKDIRTKFLLRVHLFVFLMQVFNVSGYITFFFCFEQLFCVLTLSLIFRKDIFYINFKRVESTVFLPENIWKHIGGKLQASVL